MNYPVNFFYVIDMAKLPVTYKSQGQQCCEFTFSLQEAMTNSWANINLVNLYTLLPCLDGKGD